MTNEWTGHREWQPDLCNNAPSLAMSTRFLGPAVDLSAAEGNQTVTQPRKRRGRTVEPLLPGQQSRAERSAHRKNRVLQRRLQCNLDTITRDKQSYLSGMHLEATRYKRRAVALTDLLPRTTFAATPVYGSTVPSSSPESSPTRVTSRWRRPATSVDFGRPKGHRDVRAKTAGHPRSVTTTTNVSAASVLPSSGQEKPLFKVRDNVVKIVSSDDDDDDSDDDTTTHSSEDSEVCATRDGNSCRERPPSLGARRDMSRNGGDRSQKLQLRSSTGKTRNSSQTSPQYNRVTNRERQMQSSVQRNVSSFGRFSTPSPMQKHRSNGTIDSGQSPMSVPGPRNRQRTASTSLAEGDSCGTRDASYIRFVLAMERDRYELSQMKVRSYLQNLQI